MRRYEKADLADHLGQVGLDLFGALRRAGDLLLRPDNGKGTANGSRGHQQNQGDAARTGFGA